jgi:FkbM family methyltransferase
MESRRIFFDKKTYTIYGDPTDSYFRSGFASDGWRTCGYHFQQIIGKNSICIDVGANIGVTAIGFGTLAAKVYAIEPSPKNYYFLTKNIEANRLTNISAFQFAIATRPGELPFYDTRGFRAGSFLCREHDSLAALHHGEDAIKVKTISLDEFVEGENIERVSLLKVDVEGFEHEVLVGAKEMLRRFHPITILEFNPYCLVSHANYLPTQFIDLVFGIFDEVHVHTEQVQSVSTVSNAHDRHNLLHDAFRFGLVNLICTFNDKKLDPNILRASRQSGVLFRIKSKMKSLKAFIGQ